MRQLATLALLAAPVLAFAGALDLTDSGDAFDPRDDVETDLPFGVGFEAEPIINGVDATIDDYPAAGGMLMDAYVESPFGNYDMRSFVCSSTLIAPDVVLLAAHCLDEAAFTMGSGSMDIHEVRWSRQADMTAHDGSAINEWPADSIVAWDWVTNGGFDMETLQTGLAENFDIALLFLDTPVLDVAPATLVTTQESSQIVTGSDVVVVGWGQQIATNWWEAPPPGSYGLKQMGDSFIATLDFAEFQVGVDVQDVRKCHGDSGGPTFMLIDSESTDPMRLIGVTSHAYDDTDCFETGGVDTRVDHYLTWIDQEMTSRCNDGTRVWCDVPGIIPPPMPVVDPDDEEGVKSCGCSATPGVAGLGWLGLMGLGLVGWRRRR